MLSLQEEFLEGKRGDDTSVYQLQRDRMEFLVVRAERFNHKSQIERQARTREIERD